MDIMSSIDPLLYQSQLLILKNMLNGNSFINSLHGFIKKNEYKIHKSIPFEINIKQMKNSRRNVDFDETWNTVDFFHMFIPRKRTYYVDPEAMTCTCACFKTTNKCDHVLNWMARRVIYSLCENMSVTIDITKIVVNFLR